MRIIFIRHGEPNYEKDCLTEEGRRQAVAVAERLKEENIEKIYASSMGRAAETAAPVAEVLGLPVHSLDFMRELRWGSMDGVPVPSDGHPWDIANRLMLEGWDLTSPAWRTHPYFLHNLVTESADRVAREIDGWLSGLGYDREGFCYRCTRADDRQSSVALFSHGGSSSAALAHMLNLTFPYTCAVFHQAFTTLTVLRMDRQPGSLSLPCLELVNDCRHLPEKERVF